VPGDIEGCAAEDLTIFKSVDQNLAKDGWT
jgi:hypothetical protein